MENNTKTVQTNAVWGLFFTALFVHFFLFFKAQAQFFIYFFNNTHVFIEAVSSAYQESVNSGRVFPFFYRFAQYGIGNYWPPIVPIIGLWTLWLFPSAWVLLFINFFYLVAAMLGIYFSTKILSGNHFCSMFAAVIFSCYWIVMIQLVAFELLLAATAALVWSFYWYLQSRFFTRLLPSLLTGLFMVVALYCDRATSVLFSGALFLIPKNFINKKSWLFMTLALLFVVVLAWPFYGAWIQTQFRNSETTGSFFGQSGDSASAVEAYATVFRSFRFLLAHLSYYFISMTESLLGFGFTGLLILGAFFLHRLKAPYGQVLPMAIAIPLAALILVIKKDYTYMFPLCPYFAMISGMGAFFIKANPIRYLLISGVIGLFIAQSFFFLIPFASKREFLFSHCFDSMRPHKIPRLFLYNTFPFGENRTEQLQSFANQVGTLITQKAPFEGTEQAVFVDLKEYPFQHSLVFLLRMRFKGVKVINGFFSDTPKFGKNGEEKFSYLLSDKEDYFVKNNLKSGLCPLRGLLSVYRFPRSQITLYQVQK